MKELSIEQKAKAYDEAIEKAKIWQEHLYDVNDKDYADELNYIFPELKESEDERIRKFLMREFYNPGAPDSYYRDSDITYNEIYNWLEKQGEQKPTWSEEDKKYENIIVSLLNNPNSESMYNFHEVKREDVIDWFKSLKDRVQPRQEWSEEDESRMDNLCHFLEEYGNQYYGHLTLQGTISWLKSLKPQPKQEWSEEDKTNIDSLLDVLYRIKKGKDPQATTRLIEQHVNFIKSLKERYAWKPSEEQINALAKNVEYVNVGCTQPILKELLEDLKKLKS